MVLAKVDFVQSGRTSALSLFSLRKLLVTQDLVLYRQSESEVGGGGCGRQIELNVICVTMKLVVIMIKRRGREQNLVEI